MLLVRLVKSPCCMQHAAPQATQLQSSNHCSRRVLMSQLSAARVGQHCTWPQVLARCTLWFRCWQLGPPSPQQSTMVSLLSNVLL